MPSWSQELPRFLRRGPSLEEQSVPLGMVSGMVCLRCGRAYGLLKSALWCPECGMEGILDIRYDYDSLGKVLTPARLGQAASRAQWRYLPLLPVRGLKRVPPLEVGGTPLYDAANLAETVGMDRIWLKDESKNPTGSVEDRATAIAVARAREDNYAQLTCGATGSAALSSAAFCAAAGLRTTLFVSHEADESYVAQLLLLGSEVFVVEGGREDAVQLSLRCAEEYGWYNRNRAVNPFLVEGMKTVAYELGEQLQWQVPDWVVVPVGEGSTIGALWKGFREMRKMGWINRLPRMVGVQAQGASPVFSAWRENGEPRAVRAETIAESLAVGAPRDWRRAVAAVRESNGLMVAVSDREILQAMHLLGERSGILAEPGSAATLAGLVSLLRSRQIPRKSSAVLLIAESGLRHPEAAVEAGGTARTVPPDFNRLRAIIHRSLARTPFD